MNHRDGTIQRLDPQTNTPDEPVVVYPFDKMISIGDNLLLESETSVAVFDPETSKVFPPVRIQGVIRGLAFDPKTNTAWVGSSANGTLTQVDAETGRVLDRLTIKGLPSGGDIVFTGTGEMWIATFHGEVLGVDVAKQRVVSRLQPFGVPAEVHIVSAGGFVWAVDPSALVRIDPQTEAIGPPRQLDVTKSLGFPGLAAPPDGTLWLATSPDRIAELDPNTGRTLKAYTIPLTEDINGYFSSGITTGFGSVWTTTFDDLEADHTVVRIQSRQR
jgi:DNA-binding beta-propeller fold protein YncE